MAYASWLTVDPISGSGDSSVNVVAAEHTGRLSRETTVTITGEGVEGEASKVHVVQAGAELFVSGQDSVSIPAAGGDITWRGNSNSKQVTFEFIGEAEGATIVNDSYNAGGTTVENGAEIPNDPGASAAYALNVVVTAPATESLEAIVRTVKVTVVGENNEQKTMQFTFTQTAAAAFLNVSPATISLGAKENLTGSFEIDSNTNWTIS